MVLGDRGGGSRIAIMQNTQNAPGRPIVTDCRRFSPLLEVEPVEHLAWIWNRLVAVVGPVLAREGLGYTGPLIAHSFTLG